MTMGLPQVPDRPDSGRTGADVKLRISGELRAWAFALRTLPQGVGIGPDAHTRLAGRAELLAGEMERGRTKAAAAAAAANQFTGFSTLWVIKQIEEHPDTASLHAAAQTLLMIRTVEQKLLSIREPSGGGWAERLEVYMAQKAAPYFGDLAAVDDPALFPSGVAQ